MQVQRSKLEVHLVKKGINLIVFDTRCYYNKCILVSEENSLNLDHGSVCAVFHQNGNVLDPKLFMLVQGRRG